MIQSDLFDNLPAVTVLPITSTIVDPRFYGSRVEPCPQNGLGKPSRIMVDRPQTSPRGKLGGVIGRLDDASLLAVNRALAVLLGLT